MSPDEVIETVKTFATKAHGEQRRKYTPEPYIVHPIRVMELLREYTSDRTILCAALLHDVLEDTPVDKVEMLSFLRTVMNEEDAQRTLQLVVELTDVYIKEDYPQYNRNKRKQLERERAALTSADSQTIKYADIIDNCREIVSHDRHFATVFLNECRKLLNKAKMGHPELYHRAIKQNSDAIQFL